MGGGNNNAPSAYPSQASYGQHQGMPNSFPQGNRSNPPQAYVPPFVKNDSLAYAPRQNMVESQVDQSSSSSTYQYMMYDMMTNLMAKMNGMESVTSQILN